MSYDVAALRARIPALSAGTAHFDGPGGTQTPAEVAAAVAGALTAPLANRSRDTAAGRHADDVVVGAREAVADLLGADPGGVVFGRSMTALTYDLARALAKGWGPGDEVVVTRLDHDANIRPWVQAAEAVGATVRWAAPEPLSAELPVDAVAAVIGERTRLVACTAASNLVGTRPDIPAISAAAHRVGALCFVDGVHLAAHAPIDVAALGADVLACSPYKWLGPHCGVLAADPGWLATVRPDKLAASSDEVPERFEMGTLPYELLAGVTAAVEVLADLADPADPTGGPASTGGPARIGGTPRRQRLLASMAAVERHEGALFDRLLTEVAGLAEVFRHGTPAHCTPTALLTVGSDAPAAVSAFLAGRGVNAPAGSFYAIEASRVLGLGDTGGVRVGLAPYTDDRDVDRLMEGLNFYLRER